MELRQLQYFVAVADTLSFSRAAEGLFVSQPTLSNQISDLEAELGVKLLERTKRTVFLTDAGATFLRDARDLLRQADQMRIIRTGVPAVEAPHLNIGFTQEGMDSNPLCQAVIKVVRQLRAEHPEGNFFFQSCDSADPEAALKQYDVLIDIWSAQDARPSLNHFVISQPSFLLVTAAEVPPIQGREDLIRLLGEREIFLNQENLSHLGEIMGLFSALQAFPKIRYWKNGDSIRIQVLSGDGIMVIPEDELVQLARFAPVRPIPLDIPEARLLRGIRWNGNNMNPLIQTFCHRVKEHYDALVKASESKISG